MLNFHVKASIQQSVICEKSEVILMWFYLLQWTDCNSLEQITHAIKFKFKNLTLMETSIHR